MSPIRSLSGIKPTGTPHLGNYLGMIRPAIDLQDTHEAFYFVADYHALTTERDAQRLRSFTLDIVAQFLAFGLDIEKARIYRQSSVPQVTELSWILSCVTNMGLLNRAHSFKAAKDRGEDNLINHGVFSYPILMAADILIMAADVVPVGKDQIQHIEMCREMASKFNRQYGDLLHLPDPLVREDVATVPGTDGQKMSKSYDNIINPLASPEELWEVCKVIKTDSTPITDPMDPDACNVFAIYQHFSSSEEEQQMRQDYRSPTFGYGHAKRILCDKLVETFAPYRDAYMDYRGDTAYLLDVLVEDEQVLRLDAEERLEAIRETVGVGQRF